MGSKLIAIALGALCVAAASDATASPSGRSSSHIAGQTSPKSSYRFVRPPIVTISRSSTDTWYFDAFVRVNRALPRKARGGLDADVVLNDSGDPALAHLGMAKRHCYIQDVVPDFTTSHVLLHPHPGQRVRVELWVHGKLEDRTHVRLIRGLKNPTGTTRIAPYARPLGCVPSGPASSRTA